MRVAVSVSGSSINLRHHHVGEGWVGSNSIIAKYQCQCRHVGILFFIVVNISLKKRVNESASFKLCTYLIAKI